MFDIIVGERVVNKTKETGTIVSFDDKYIYVDFKNRTSKVQRNAFEQGFLKYENVDLQSEANKNIKQAKIEAEANAERTAIKKAQEERWLVESKTADLYSNIHYESISLRLDPVSINYRGVENKEDRVLIREIFAECDKDAKEIYASFNPKMEYPKMTSRSKTRYSTAFLCKYLNTYVLRVFSRNDIYKKRVRSGITILESDTTEIFRIVYINGEIYRFTKDTKYFRGELNNSTSFVRWHLSYFTSFFFFDEIIRICDCKYLNDYITEEKINCSSYVKLLFPALYSSKAEIVFKNKLFSSTSGIDDIVSYLEPFSSKQIDFASKNDVVNALPFINRYGIYDIDILIHMEKIMNNNRRVSTYNFLKEVFKEHRFDDSDLDKKLIDFVKKVEFFDIAVYNDYLNMLRFLPGLTVADLFDKNYLERHDEMNRERWGWFYHDKETEKKYKKAARELSWIDREENGYFITVPKTILEIREEGENQHNCVYKGRYYDFVIDRVSILVFLRKNKETSYVTIEFNYDDFCVMQAYGKFNKIIDDDLYKYIVDLGKRLNQERASQ